MKFERAMQQVCRSLGLKRGAIRTLWGTNDPYCTLFKSTRRGRIRVCIVYYRTRVRIKCSETTLGLTEKVGHFIEESTRLPGVTIIY